MVEFEDVKGIRISLASPEQIRSWSHGEVTKAETINYRTLKPERDGLFCERIFGPVKDYECHCGKYKKKRYAGITCDKCGVEVAPSSVRRERMGHIELATPVAHIWFTKLVPSRLALILGISPRDLERVIYFAQHIIISVNREACDDQIHQMEEEVARKISESEEQVSTEVEELKEKAGFNEDDESVVKEINHIRAKFVEQKEKFAEDLKARKDEIAKLQPLKLLSDERRRELVSKYGDIFHSGIGAEAISEILKQIGIEKLYQDLLQEVEVVSGEHRKKTVKRLQLVEALKRSGNKLDWVILTVLPVLPPSLRPIVQLDNGRFATSDLNDLYRRVINRNNRLRRLMSLGAPQVIIRNEKRMLQEAVDALIDNGRRRPVVTNGNKHPLKSLAAMLSGKQGRFRQNLLGKRVDYSGRSVIVVGPQLELHQCGLPRHVALELFKPFVMRKLIEAGYATNLKSARHQVEKVSPEVWGLLNDVVRERPVLLNRAPTLHRLSIQAFDPILIDGNAFQLHPLACAAFNADFDGDQMAVHVPLSRMAVRESKEHMLSVHNMLLPSNGEPVVSPTLDIVLGCYYLTRMTDGVKGEGKAFSNFAEARLAYDLGVIDLGAKIMVRDKDRQGERIDTTVGRILFNDALPPKLRFFNNVVDKGTLKELVSKSIRLLGNEVTAVALDAIKRIGFKYAMQSGISFSMDDVEEPADKPQLIAEADNKAAIIENSFNRGELSDNERYESTVRVWLDTIEGVTEAVSQSMNPRSDIYMMATSGARGNISQVAQMAGMRGLMTDPSGKIIDFPIKSSFRGGLSAMEYFISTHGARKGLADTALRTSDSGYLTRRLIDVAQDIIITEKDCGTTQGVWIFAGTEDASLPSFGERIIGYLAAAEVADPETGEVIVNRNEEIDGEVVRHILDAGVTKVYVRSPLTCRSRFGICQYCYGRDLSKLNLVKKRVAVGIVAAQSIGEPGTQLTLRTFHTGGVVGIDITSGLPRVSELFEARTPKGVAIMSEIDGVVQILEADEQKTIRIVSSEVYSDEHILPLGTEAVVVDGQEVSAGTPLFSLREAASQDVKSLPVAMEGDEGTSKVAGRVSIEGDHIYIKYEEKEEREYKVPHGVRLLVRSGSEVRVGEQLTEGVLDPRDVLRVNGREAVQHYLVDEVQKIYHSQGVNIHDKHISIIVRQMLSKVNIISSGDAGMLPGEVIGRFDYEDVNAKALAEGGEPATAQAILLGISKVSLGKESWLAAASFQETGRVLTNTAIMGKVDRLRGLKENVILGKFIPSQVLAKEEIEEVNLQLNQGVRVGEGTSLDQG